ncbi:hypothetical protein HOK51_05190 [Candidatus Woesearchaeota archaeon]|nr:hypothetical protein [Candidatus Woesearchaeota archaeon]MBT6519222.1 hypothetical protein [Candidatus Woesearchaeota archaeon]MBT7367507.1 hypothetical protein [Candidatus Woesearchaeota archaeon]
MIPELKEFGLSDNEITTYLTLLKVGETSANRISQLTGMKRTTTYDNLSLLITKGIVSKIVKDNVQYFIPAEPTKLSHLLEEKKKKIDKIIPELNKLKQTIREKSGVTFYEGKKGVLTVLNDIIDQKKKLWFYGSRKMALISLKHYPDNFIHKRAEEGIKLQAVLAEEDRKDKIYSEEDISKLSELKYLKELNKIKTNTFIYGDRVAFMTSEENPSGIIIRNQQIVSQQKKIFELIWKSAKK